MLQFHMAITETIEEGMFQADNPINQLNRMLVRYDMTPNQAKVYLFLNLLECFLETLNKFQ